MMSEKDTNIMFIDLANYNSPVICEDQRDDIVYYGADNNYFGYLIDRYRGSPTNNAIINSISQMIVGDGLISPFASQRPQDYARAVSWFTTEKLTRWAFDLKCLGFYVMLIRKDSRGEIAEIDYSPVQNYRASVANDEGEIESYWYSDNWQSYSERMQDFQRFTPEEIPVYSKDSTDAESVYVVKPYRSGSFYYPTVDYQGGLQWAHIEEEVGNFHLNNIMNGFAPGLLINFNNGDPGKDQRDKIERKAKARFQGSSKAGSVMLSFNVDKEHAVTVEQIGVSDIDKQYQFISEEATKKIIQSHAIPSPLLFGVHGGSGLGSNADEIRQSYLLLEARMKPYRRLMLDPITTLLNDAGFNLPLEFNTDKPKEFETEKNTKQELDLSSVQLMPEEDVPAYLDWIDETGEEINEDEWELIDSWPVDYDTDDEFDMILQGFELASVVESAPQQRSTQDNALFKTRYVYAGSKSPEREFCRKMMSAGKVYRKEDIIKSNRRAVNPGWGPKGANTYNIWFYKGGGNCQHFWERRLYMRKNNKRISSKQARAMINKVAPKYRKNVRQQKNDPRVAKLPQDMPYNGFLPSNPVYGR